MEQFMHVMGRFKATLWRWSSDLIAGRFRQPQAWSAWEDFVINLCNNWKGCAGDLLEWDKSSRVVAIKFTGSLPGWDRYLQSMKKEIRFGRQNGLSMCPFRISAGPQFKPGVPISCLSISPTFLCISSILFCLELHHTVQINILWDQGQRQCDRKRMAAIVSCFVLVSPLVMERIKTRLSWLQMFVKK
jgi:hypothetical protein